MAKLEKNFNTVFALNHHGGNGAPKTKTRNLRLVDHSIARDKGATDHRHDINLKMKALRDAIRVRRDERPTASFQDHLVGRLISFLSKPAALWVQTGVFVGYVAYNLLVPAKFDPYPFMFLSFLVNLASGYTTVVLCNAQRREDAETEELGNAEAKVFEKMLHLLDEINDKLENKNNGHV